jgi:hypothetical protein
MTVCLILAVMTSCTSCFAGLGTVTLLWDAPTNYTDGSVLPPSEIYGYEARAVSVKSPVMTNITTVTTTSCVFSAANSNALAKGSWVFDARTLSTFSDDNGVRIPSDWSTSITGKVWGIPGKPTVIRIP